MSKLVKQRARVVIGQQTRLALGKVADVDHDGPCLRAQFLLAAHGRAPRARAFGATGEVISQENSHMRAVAGDLPAPHIGVVEGAIDLAELEPEEAMCAVKLCRQHSVERQVGLQRGLIQIMLGLAALFAVIAPIPRLQRSDDAIGVQHCLEHGGIRQRLFARRLPDPHQKAANRCGCLGHLGFQFEIGKTLISQEFRPLLPQGKGFGRNCPVVVGVAIGAACDPSLIGVLPQGAAGAELQEGHDDRA